MSGEEEMNKVESDNVEYLMSNLMIDKAELQRERMRIYYENNKDRILRERRDKRMEKNKIGDKVIETRGRKRVRSEEEIREMQRQNQRRYLERKKLKELNEKSNEKKSE
jgi:hypothetical protein